MIEPVAHRLVVKAFDITESDDTYRSAKAAGIVLSGEDKLKREQEEKFREYINLLKNYPNDDLHLINAPYFVEAAIQSITNWHNKISDYVESRCMAEIQTKSGSSGFDGLKADCEISIYQSNIDFLNDRIKSFQEYSANIENLIETGVINKDTTY